VPSLDGYPLDNAPNFNGTFSAAYKFSLPWGWDGDVSLNGKYSSQYDFLPGGGGPLGLDRQGGYFLGTMSGYLYPLKGLRVGIYVDNFTNKFYVTTAETGAIGAFQIPAEPRTYGVSLTYKWGN
jgi:iron complex outermembrane recepter protein